MAYWLFQANPFYSRILAAIAELDQIHWLVTRYAIEIIPGDQVLIWICGRQAGLYATAEVMAPPHFLNAPPDLAYWLVPARAYQRVYAPVRLTHKLLLAPVTKLEALLDPELSTLTVLKAPHNTNFRVTQAQWQRVQELLAER